MKKKSIKLSRLLLQLTATLSEVSFNPVLANKAYET